MQVELCIEAFQHKGSIGRTTTETCSQRDDFMKMDINGRQVINACKQTIGFYAQVVLPGSVNLYSGCRKGMVPGG